MKKRLLALAASLLMAFAPCGAQASAMSSALPGGIDQSVSSWLSGNGLRFTMTMELEKLLPFTDDTLSLINGALKGISLGAALDESDDEKNAYMQLKAGTRTALTVSERFSGEAYETMLSALPGRVLISYVDAPTRTLSGGYADDGFSLIYAIDECEAAKAALIDKATPFMTTKKANYNIKGIGKGRTSNIVKLTEAQAELLAADMRAALKCGMDEKTRAIIDGLTFDKQFTLALYQNADGDDIALYMKGGAKDESGAKHTLRYQWAMLRGEAKSADTYVFELKKSSKPTRSIVIEGSREIGEKSGAFTLDIEQKSTITESGNTIKRALDAGIECRRAGEKRVISGRIKTTGGDETITLSPNLTLTPEDGVYAVSGDMGFEAHSGKTARVSLKMKFSNSLPSGFWQSVTSEEAYLGDASPETPLPQGDGAVSAWQVGAPPIGVAADAAPETQTELLIDILTPQELEALTRAASQNLAGELLLGLITLGGEYSALLGDGMLETDFRRILDMVS